MTTAPRDTTRLVARYKMADMTLSGMFQKSKLSTPTAVSGDKADESAIVLSGSYTIDKLTLRGEVLMNTIKGVPTVASTPKDKISLIGVGVDYNLTQTTKVFGNLAARKDKYSGVLGASPSENASLVGVGMETRF
jgi:predicted porin